jgi:hypothetical protein
MRCFARYKTFKLHFFLLLGDLYPQHRTRPRQAGCPGSRWAGNDCPGRVYWALGPSTLAPRPCPRWALRGGPPPEAPLLELWPGCFPGLRGPRAILFPPGRVLVSSLFKNPMSRWVHRSHLRLTRSHNQRGGGGGAPPQPQHHGHRDRAFVLRYRKTNLAGGCALAVVRSLLRTTNV